MSEAGTINISQQTDADPKSAVQIAQAIETDSNEMVMSARAKYQFVNYFVFILLCCFAGCVALIGSLSYQYYEVGTTLTLEQTALLGILTIVTICVLALWTGIRLLLRKEYEMMRFDKLFLFYLNHYLTPLLDGNKRFEELGDVNDVLRANALSLANEDQKVAAEINELMQKIIDQDNAALINDVKGAAALRRRQQAAVLSGLNVEWKKLTALKETLDSYNSLRSKRVKLKAEVDNLINETDSIGKSIEEVPQYLSDVVSHAAE